MLLPLVALVLALAFVPSASAQTNVVVFLTDDQTVAQVRYMPNVQRLLEERGTSFTRNFATFPLCCPSRATLMTGQYAHNHSVIHNAGQFGGYKRLNHSQTLPVWLKLAGYRTLQVGRWLNNYGVDNAQPRRDTGGVGRVVRACGLLRAGVQRPDDQRERER